MADRTPRILFVANAMLGWKTYSRTFAGILAAREDVASEVIWWRTTPVQTMFLKRNGMQGASRHFRRIDPIWAYQHVLGRALRSAVRRNQFDAVHFAAHWPSASLTGVTGAPPFSVALDCTRPGINALLGAPVWSNADIVREARLLRRAAHLFPMSDWAGSSLVADMGVDPDRITLSPPSVQIQETPRNAPSGESVNIVFVGNDFARKGGARLVDWVTGPLAGTCHLHIVSGDPAAQISAPGVTAYGAVSNAQLSGEILPRMDIFCLPTRLDMSPFVLAEAAAAGLPAVASDIAGIGGLVIDGQTGFTVAADNDAGFIDALNQLIGDKGLRAQMGGAARQRACATFDAQKNADRVIDRLVQLAGQGT